MVQGRDVARAFVNNGGDIAFHLAAGTSLRCGLVADIFAYQDKVGRMGSSPPPLEGLGREADQGWGEGENPTVNPISPDGTFLLTASHPARGLATSGRACKGRGGRSFSFGIADAVTVLARTAAQADAAATIIGNAVDLPGHHAIDRRPASEIDAASDLHDRLITFDVGPLSNDAIEAALHAGETMAARLLRNGLIEGAVLALRGHLRIRHVSLALSSLAPRSLEPA
jgi:ApbE superfamily uncharacterized protein (UPF0280 family)